MEFATARWIRGPEEEGEQNVFWCFRKDLILKGSGRLRITADSRYFLYVNGRFIGTGPDRFWPEAPYYREYDVAPPAGTETLFLAVLVWHYGTSTSQYIHAAGGLLAEVSDETGVLPGGGSDSTWRCRRHSGYPSPAPRINVSQPWLELFDGDAFPADWTSPSFDDGKWARAVDASREFQGRKPRLSETAPLASELKTPAALLDRRLTASGGWGFRIDYKEAFYPGDTTTEDRLHSGFLCCLIHSPREQEAVFFLLDRKWPLEEEFFYTNGRRHVLSPEESRKSFHLPAGETLFLFEITGAYQRMWADFYFEASGELQFSSPPGGGGTPFSVLGPIESYAIGNIVCSDGFTLDRNHRILEALRRCRSGGELPEGTLPVAPPPRVFRDLPKHRGLRSTSVGEAFLPSPAADFSCPQGAEIAIPECRRGDRELLLDMGEEVSGFLEFTLDSAGPVVLEILFCEYLRPSGEMEIPGDLDTSLRILWGGGSLSFRSVLRRGFRYLRLALRSPGGAVLKDLRVDQRLYPWEAEGRFCCSDPLLNRVDEICLRTLRLCREDTYVDCPAFEQVLWLGDIYSMARANHMVYRAPELAEHTIRLGAESLKNSYLPDCHLPAGVRLTLTAWSLFWLLAACEHVHRTGRRQFGREILPAVVLTLDRLIALISPRGLLEIDAWNMLDWGGMDTPYRGIVAHQNALLVRVLEGGASFLETVAPGTPGGVRFLKAAEDLRRRVDETFWDETHQAYRDCIGEDGTPSPVVSIPTNLMMLLGGCVPPERREAVKGFILDPPADAVPCGSPFLAGFLLEFMFQENRSEEALRRIRSLWGPMVEEGSSTCWETFRGFYKDRLTRSYCHGWSCSPSELLRRHILGVPEEAGRRADLVLSPISAGLTFAEGSVPLPEGRLEVSWKIEGGCFFCTVETPPNYRVEVIPPPELPDTVVSVLARGGRS